MDHYLGISPETVHGTFAASRPPVLTVDSGDSVTLSTLDAWWGLEPFSTPYYALRKTLKSPESFTGHALTGPICIKNMLPGEILEIFFEELIPANKGFTECGGISIAHYQRLGCADETHGPQMLLWDIHHNTATTHLPANQLLPARQLSIPINPFLGVVGMPPALPGHHSTTPPRRTGGNLDCNLLTQGSRLFLPVEVAGGLLSLGDGHAAQGDGEVSNNGIECAFDKVKIKLTRRTDLHFTTPIIKTTTSWVTLGLAPTLDEAAYQATNAMLDLVSSELKCSRIHALGITSANVNLRVTQIVNGIKGIHAEWKVC